MSIFVERYRYAIGSALLGLILSGAAFLLWRENKWKPGLEKRLDALQLEIEQAKISATPANETAQTSDVNPTNLIEQSQAAGQASGKVAGASIGSTSSKATAKSATTKSTASGSTASTQTACSSSAAKPPLPATPININTATCYQLMALPGIGATTAQNIVDYRTAHGSFTSVQQLDNVKNIGTATLNKIREHVTVN